MGLDRHPPQFLMNATRFETSAAIFNPLWVITTLRRYEGEPYRLLDPLDRAATALDSRGVRLEVGSAGSKPFPRSGSRGNGRPRLGGRFDLAYLAFVFSRHPDVRPWWAHAGHSIWQACGFRAGRPAYASCQRRFAELEDPLYMAAFEEVARSLIQLAVKGSKGQVGRYLHVDATEAETHARLEHVCPPNSPCRSRYGGKAVRITPSVTTPLVRARRHEQAELPEPEQFHDEIGDADEIRYEKDKLRLKVGGCLYDVLDPTAGVRAYTRDGRTKRFWLGFYNGKAIDHFTGAPVAVLITSASIQEHRSYPQLYEAATTNTGVQPAAVVGDRGYSISSVFEHNTSRGVASVMPWRAHVLYPDRSREDTDTHDRHGVVRCKHCGAPTAFVSFARTAGAKRGKAKRGPRLYVRCLAPVTPECRGRQSIGCAVSWRMLLPLWRLNPTYMALRHAHDRYERVHHHWRVRWRSGADDHALRPKRRGLANQQLRANAALLVEWLMICWREDWLPDSRPMGCPCPDRVFEDDGQAHLDDLEKARAALGLDRPYGPKAKEMKVGPARPRPRKAAKSRKTKPKQPKPKEPITEPEAVEEPYIEVLGPGQTPENAAEVDLQPLGDDDLPF